jgi:hypothetical protein
MAAGQESAERWGIAQLSVPIIKKASI